MTDLVFEKLISPITRQLFFAEVWERKPLLIKREAPQHYSNLLSLSDVDAVLAAPNLMFPDVRLAKVDETIDPGRYIYSNNRIDTVAVCKLFSTGATIILDAMQLKIRALGRLCRSLGKELGIEFQTNLYLTPPNSGAFNIHYDAQLWHASGGTGTPVCPDIFVLQIVGSKKWELFESSVEIPMPWQNHEPGHLSHSFVLNAGDALYIPRGVYHRVCSGSELSLHVTLGAHARTWREFLLEAVNELALHDQSLRRALPIGFSVGRFDMAEAVEQFRNLLKTISEAADFGACLAKFKDDFARTIDPLLEGHLLQTIALHQLAHDTIVTVVEDACYSITRTNNSLKVRYGNSQLEFPISVEMCVLDLLSGGSKCVGDLGGGSIGTAGKKEVVRRMTEIGLTRIVEKGLSLPEHRLS